MKSKEQQLSVVNDEFFIENENSKAENFSSKFRLDSKNSIEKSRPKVIDIVDDMEEESADKLAIVKNQSVNTV